MIANCSPNVEDGVVVGLPLLLSICMNRGRAARESNDEIMAHTSEAIAISLQFGNEKQPLYFVPKVRRLACC